MRQSFAAFLLWATLLLCAQGQQQYLPGLSTDVSDLSTFFNLLNSTQDLYTQVKQGGVTIFAPTNDAFAALGLTEANSTSSSQLEALLRYHILEGIHTEASLTDSSAFYHSLLQSPECSNNTGGQVIKAANINGTDVLISGLGTRSAITQADISYQHGIMHGIDTVFDIPIQIAQTVVDANLTDYEALGIKMRLANPQIAPFVYGLQNWPDSTVFGPNSPEYGANFTAWDNLTIAQDLSIWLYHLINATILYSTNITNGSVYTTSGGLNVTTWIVGSDLYINDAKVIQPDLLQANGVIQVLDRPLDPTNTEARPVFLAANSSTESSPTSSSSGSSGTGGLSTGAKAGIGVGAAVAALAVIGAIFGGFFARKRRASRKGQPTELDGSSKDRLATNEMDGMNRTELSTNGDKLVTEMQASDGAHELQTLANQRPAELDGGPVRAHELQGSTPTTSTV